ncbi:MAG: hypothetical protein WC389_14275 [Lutibacter sp.]
MKKQSVLPERPAKASNYLHHYKTYRRKHPKLVIIGYGRVSGKPQFERCNLDTYETILQKRCEKHNNPFLVFFGEQCSGKTWYFQRRKEFMAAIAEAKKQRALGEDVAILTPATNRLLRNINYSKTNQNVLPTETEFEELIKLADGIPLLTLLHPNMSEKKVRGFQTKWGQRIKNNKGGRPKKKEPVHKKPLRLEKSPIARQLYKKGRSYRTISKLTGTPKSTVVDWVKKGSL